MTLLEATTIVSDISLCPIQSENIPLGMSYMYSDDYIFIEIQILYNFDSVLWLLFFDFADDLKTFSASIFYPEDGSSIHLKNVSNVAYNHTMRTEYASLIIVKTYITIIPVIITF
jgi:hypothetical protein